MSTIKQQLESLKTKLETLEKARQKELGRQEQLMSQLREFGVDSYEAGRKLEAEMRAKQEADEAAAEILIKEIETEFADFI